MKQIKQLLETRENYLLNLKKQKEKELQDAPEGSLRLGLNGNRVQYYHRTDPKDFSGVYIREKKLKLAQRLAQKDYNKKVLGSVEKELHAIQKYFASCPQVEAEMIYEHQHKERQKLILPIKNTDAQYVHAWETVEYQGKDFSADMPELYTAKGERVRSKSEVIIADLLDRRGIPYRYEYPLHLKDRGVFHPDFTVLCVQKREEIYWEHLGMMDDAEYVENALQKIAIYEQNGIFPGKNLILTFETKKKPLNQNVVGLIIEEYLGM